MIDELSIIIPALNEEKYLPLLLDSILDQGYPYNLQVIVVDGHSKDNTIKVAKSYEKKFKDLLVITAEKNIGIQRNKGAEKAKYKYIAFIDADIILPSHFFQKLLKKINPNPRFFISVMLWPTGKNILDYIVVALFVPTIFIISRFKSAIFGGFILTTKENHQRIKGFKEDIKMGEDVDYGKRSVKDGAKYYFFLIPYLYHSVRRVREIGRFGLVWLWLRLSIYAYLKKEPKNISYPYGHYTDLK